MAERESASWIATATGYDVRRLQPFSMSRNAPWQQMRRHQLVSAAPTEVRRERPGRWCGSEAKRQVATVAPPSSRLWDPGHLVLGMELDAERQLIAVARIAVPRALELLAFADKNIA